jgi:hypothetical protein
MAKDNKRKGFPMNQSNAPVVDNQGAADGQAPEDQTNQQPDQQGESGGELKDSIDQGVEGGSVVASEAPTQESTDQAPAQDPVAEPAKEVKISGEITQKYDAPVGQAAPAQEQAAVAAERVDTDVDNRSDFQKHIDNLLINGTVREKYVIAFMNKYVTSMAPGVPLTVDEGVRNQTELWRTIKNVVENQDGFEGAFRLLIAYARNYRSTVFHESYLFRFTENTVLAPADARTFERLLNVILTASGVQNRREVTKLIDLNNRLTAGLTEDARNRLILYFTK